MKFTGKEENSDFFCSFLLISKACVMSSIFSLSVSKMSTISLSSKGSASTKLTGAMFSGQIAFSCCFFMYSTTEKLVCVWSNTISS